MINMATKYPHIEWIDLEGNGTLTEIAVVKVDENQNVYFIKLSNLDGIDRQRLANIITNRNSKSFELWDLLSQATLGNGQNALNYFHQFVKIKTPNGQILDPSSGQVGAAMAANKETLGVPVSTQAE
jgi:hypothetical protein